MKKRTEAQMKIKYFLNLKRKQKQLHLALNCLVNVTSAVTFIQLSTSCKMLYSTAVLRWEAGNRIYQLLIEAEYKVITKGTVSDCVKRPLVATGGKTHTSSVSVFCVFSQMFFYSHGMPRIMNALLFFFPRSWYQDPPSWSLLCINLYFKQMEPYIIVWRARSLIFNYASSSINCNNLDFSSYAFVFLVLIFSFLLALPVNVIHAHWFVLSPSVA